MKYTTEIQFQIIARAVKCIKVLYATYFLINCAQNVKIL